MVRASATPNGPHQLVAFGQSKSTQASIIFGAQQPLYCQAEEPRLGVVMLPGGETICLVTETGSCCSSRYRLDATRLQELAKQLAGAIKDGADLVMISRFGRLEAKGEGLVKLIAQSLDADIPVLIAVPERRFSDWIRFSDSMNVKLPCRRDALDRWWRSVAGTATRRRPDPVGTFCELSK